MEPNQDQSLFGLSIDPVTKSHLSVTASWAKFLAIMGFIFCILVVLAGLFAGTILAKMQTRGVEGFGNNREINTSGFGAIAAVMYIILALLYFFPCLFLFNFAAKMKNALVTNDQNTLNSSFQNLKKTFRYLGVLTIIILCFWVISMLIGLLAASSMR
jgi:Family of unknown function (DUF5362)